jgi:hypothetical protein
LVWFVEVGELGQLSDVGGVRIGIDSFVLELYGGGWRVGIVMGWKWCGFGYDEARTRTWMVMEMDVIG